MKSSGPLRTTPLERRTPLQRGGPLERHTPMPQRRVRPRLAVVVEVNPDIGEDIAKERVRARSGGWCEIRLPGCFVRALDWHHRLRDGQGGLWQASNGLDSCRWCHMAVTNTNGRYAEYVDAGWIVPRRYTLDVSLLPASVSVVLAGVGRVLLNDAGGYELVLGDAT